MLDLLICDGRLIDPYHPLIIVNTTECYYPSVTHKGGFYPLPSNQSHALDIEFAVGFGPVVITSVPVGVHSGSGRDS